MIQFFYKPFHLIWRETNVPQPPRRHRQTATALKDLQRVRNGAIVKGQHRNEFWCVTRRPHTSPPSPPSLKSRNTGVSSARAATYCPVRASLDVIGSPATENGLHASA